MLAAANNFLLNLWLGYSGLLAGGKQTYDGDKSTGIGAMLDNAVKLIQDWGGAFLIIMGAIGLVMAGYNIITGLMSENKQVNWVKQIILITFAGALLVGGFGLMQAFGDLGQNTIKGLQGK